MEKNRQQFIYILKQKNFSERDIDLAIFAYDLAKSAHRTQTRDGGERFFEHARHTALILLEEIGTVDIYEVISLLLHDTGEDTSIFGNIRDSYESFTRTAEFRLTKAFHIEVAKNVITLTKPYVDGIYFKNKTSMMKFYISALENYAPAFLLKMIDRLHNLRSLENGNVEKIEKQVEETKEILIPSFKRCIEKRDEVVKSRYYEVLEKVRNELSVLKVT